jgi:hypothetical protein
MTNKWENGMIYPKLFESLILDVVGRSPGLRLLFTFSFAVTNNGLDNNKLLTVAGTAGFTNSDMI